MKSHLIILPILFSGLAACTWVEPTKESLDVLLVKPGNVADCNKLGTTYVTVSHKIGILTRDEEAVTDDLVAVAKNKAAEMGGDSIVARGENEEGKMSFDVFDCNGQ